MRFNSLFGAALALVGVAGSAAAADYPPVDVEMELQQVSEHVYYVQGEAGTAVDNAGFISNASAVVTDAGIVIVDALGSPSLADKFLGLLRQVSDAPVKTVVLTHYHADHIYGLQRFTALGAEVIAPAGAADYIGSPQAKTLLEERRFLLDPWINEATRVVAPDRFLEDETEIEVGGVRLTLTPVGAAHSSGDMTVYVEPDQVLLSGDVIFEGRVPFVGDANTGHWLSLLEQMEAAEVRALVPGHGPAAEAPNEAVALTREYLAHLRESMGAAVEEFVPFDTAYANTDWSEFDHLPAFEAANRRNAYQVYLSLEAQSIGN